MESIDELIEKARMYDNLKDDLIQKIKMYDELKAKAMKEWAAKTDRKKLNKKISNRKYYLKRKALKQQQQH
jgi:hypothetical protein